MAFHVCYLGTNSCTIRLHDWRCIYVPWKQVRVLFGCMIGVLCMFLGNKFMYYSVAWLALYICSMEQVRVLFGRMIGIFVHVSWEQIYVLFGCMIGVLYMLIGNKFMDYSATIEYISWNMHTVLLLLCCCYVILVMCRLKWCIDHILQGLPHCHWSKCTITPVPINILRPR